MPGGSPANVAVGPAGDSGADDRAARRRAALIAITRGSDGVVAIGRESGVVRRPGRTVEVVDTVGAGDAFTSTLLASLHGRGLLGAGQRERLNAVDAATLADVLDNAVLASALTCTRRGAESPTRCELASL